MMRGVDRDRVSRLSTQVLTASILLIALVLPFRKGTKTVWVAALILGAVVALIVLTRDHVRLRKLGGTLGCAGSILLATFLSCCFSLAPGYSFQEFLDNLLGYVAGFFAVVVWAQSEKRRLQLLSCISIGAACGALYTIGGYVSGSLVIETMGPEGKIYMRAVGALGSYTKTSEFFAMSIPVSAALWVRALETGKRNELALHTAALLLSLGAIGLTYARGPWIASVFGIAIIAALHRFSLKTFALIGAIVLISLAIPETQGRLATLWTDFGNADLFFSGRPELWGIAIDAFRDHPWLGIGYGTNIFMEPAAQELYPLDRPNFLMNAHQAYLQIASESGIVGAASFAVFFVYCLWGAWSRRLFPMKRIDPGAERNDAAIASAGAIGSILLIGMVDSFMRSRIGMLFWIMLAVYCACLAYAPIAGSKRKRDADRLEGAGAD